MATRKQKKMNEQKKFFWEN